MLILALLGGVALGFFVAKALLAARLAPKDEQFTRQAQDLEVARQENTKLVADIQTQIAKSATAEAERKAAQARIDELKVENEKNIGLMKEQFGLTAKELLEKERERLRDEHNTTAQTVLEPLRTQVKALQDEVQRSRETEIRADAELQKRLEDITRINQALSQDADTLSKALRGQAKYRGNWGEKQLYQVLQDCNLRDKHEYFSQGLGLNIKFANDEAAYPDAVVLLPEGRHLIIDSKVSLPSYQDAIQAEDAGDAGAKQAAVKALSDSIRKHIDDLAAKQYDRQTGVKAAAPVMMFVSPEGALLLAASHDTNLFIYAQDKNIALVTATGLFVLMKAVDMVWSQARRSQSAEQIADLASKIGEQVVQVSGAMDMARKSIANALDSHDDAAKRMFTGNSNLVTLVEKMRKLGAAPKGGTRGKAVSKGFSEERLLAAGVDADIITGDGEQPGLEEGPPVG